MVSFMHKFFSLLLSAILGLVLVACGGKGDSAAAPTDFVATAGDGQVTLTWTQAPGVEYWIWYAPGTLAAGQDILQASGHRSLVKATSPYVFTGPINGAPYTFTIDGRTGGGPGGPKAAFQYVTPRTAGASWSTPATVLTPPATTASAATTLGSSDLRAITFGVAADTNTYHLAGGSGGALFYAADPASWIAVTASGITSNIRAATYASGRYLVGDHLGKIYYTTDFGTWTASTVPNTGKQLNAMASNGTSAVAVGNDGTIWSTGDGVTWTAATTVPTTKHLLGVAFASGGINGVNWLAVGADGTLLLSSDANTWVAPATLTGLGTSTALNAVGFRAAVTFTDASTGNVLANYAATYVAVGDGGKVITSADGVNWSLAAQNLTQDQNALSVSSSQFLSAGASGSVYTSPDGITWTARSTLPASNSRAVYAVLNTMGLLNITARYVAVGAAGTAIYAK